MELCQSLIYRLPPHAVPVMILIQQELIGTFLSSRSVVVFMVFQNVMRQGRYSKILSEPEYERNGRAGLKQRAGRKRNCSKPITPSLIPDCPESNKCRKLYGKPCSLPCITALFIHNYAETQCAFRLHGNSKAEEPFDLRFNHNPLVLHAKFSHILK